MPRLFRKASARSSSVAVEQGLVRANLVPKPKPPYGMKNVVFGLQGKVYTPAGLFIQGGGWENPTAVEAIWDEMDISDDEEASLAGVDHAEVRRSKLERRWQKWSEEVIPMLLKPYICLLRKTDSLRNLADIQSTAVLGCTGCSLGRTLEVSCVFFQSKCYILVEFWRKINIWLEIEKLVLCTCTEPTLQLLSRGLFPCAPSLPTLAVDLNMLDFVHELFVNSAPNITAWCETLEGFLNDRQFKLSTRVCAVFMLDLSLADLILKI